MKYALISDLHGCELKKLEEALAQASPDVCVCLGDFDQTRTVRQFMALKNNYERQGKHVVVVPGNHDHALLTGLSISSPTFSIQNKGFWQLYKELQADKEAKAYLNSLVFSKNQQYTTHRKRFWLDEARFGKLYQTLAVHAGYAGSLSTFPGCPDEIADLWFRLETVDDYKRNFELMEKKGYRIMLRGHDHQPLYTYRDPKSGIKSYEGNGSFRLFAERLHIVNPGALFDGNLALIDTREAYEEVPILTYLKV